MMKKKEAESESEKSRYDLIENYMLVAEIISGDAYTMLLGNCIKRLIDDLYISEKEVVETICRALKGKRVQLKHKDREVEKKFGIGEENEKIARYCKILSEPASRMEYEELLNCSYIGLVKGTGETGSVNAYFVKNMLYLLKEEKTIRESLLKKLAELEKRIENLYARFLELAGILIAIFSIIGFNLLSIKDGISVRQVIIVNCVMVFSLSALCLLIELLFMGRKIDKKSIIVLLIGVFAFLCAVLMATKFDVIVFFIQKAKNIKEIIMQITNFVIRMLECQEII